MWIQRDFYWTLQGQLDRTNLPIKVLRGPRQVGKTSLLDHLGTHRLVLFDDLRVRTFAKENPSLFFDQYSGPLLLDEATLAPEIFPELKRRVDEQRRKRNRENLDITLDIWITGSNQTLLQKSVQESLAGRASYFELNTLSLHEIRRANENQATLRSVMMRGGWPELHANPELDPVRYLNNFISTFIEKDIVSAAGIEKKAAFSKALQLSAGRIGQLLSFSDISKLVGADLTTVQSWLGLLQQNGVIKLLQPYYSNLNQRLIKTPKVYFEDVGLCSRLQGWTEYDPVFVSPYFGSLIENLAYAEISRFFSNRGLPLEIFFLRSKEKVEIDFLLQLPNQRYISIEVKASPVAFSPEQIRLLNSIQVDVVERWVVSPQRELDFSNAKAIKIEEIFENLERLL